MRYIVYSDGASDNEQDKSSSAYVIRTASTMIKCDVVAYKCSYITEAETIAVIRCLQELLRLNILNKDDSISLNIDSLTAINIITSIIEGKPCKEFSQFLFYRKLKSAIRKILKKECTIDVNKTPAHLSGHNTNKVVDKLCKHALRNMEVQKEVI